MWRQVKSFVTRMRFSGKALSPGPPGPPWVAVGRRRVGWLGSLGLVVLGLLALNPYLGQRMAQESYDLVFRLRPRSRLPVPDNLLVIRMDDESRRTLGQRREFAWDRELHARLIDNLAAAGSGPVIVDLLFVEAAAGDAHLARALANHGRVVVSANLTRRTIPGLGEVEDLEVPIAAVATNAAAVGLLNVVVGKDGVPRRLLPGREGTTDAGWEPTLSWAAARLAGRNLAEERRAPLANLWLNYYGPAETLPSISYEDAIQPESAARLRDRLIVVGANFQVDFPGARKDTFPTPYGAGRQEMPGLELHATAVLNLTRGEWLQRLDAPVEAGCVVVFGLLLGFGLPRLRPVAALAACVGMAFGVGGLSLFMAWEFHTWWAWLVPTAIQVPVGFVWALGTHLVLLGHEKEIFRRSLATYLPPRVVEEIASRPETLRLGGDVRRVVILFTDITDFSRIAQRTAPDRLVALLNEYYHIAIGCVHESDGTVLGILGDGLFAVWNAPVEQGEPERRALRAALALTERLKVFEQRVGTPAVRTRIGLHSGEACVGNFGSADHFAYTAIGDAVNLASRLNGLNKHLGTEILASREFRAGLTDQPFRALGCFLFKGFDHPVDVFQPRFRHSDDGDPGAGGVPDEAERRSESECDGGVRSLGEGRVEDAVLAFRAAVATRPDDSVALFYLERLTGLPAPTSGPVPVIIELDSK